MTTFVDQTSLITATWLNAVAAVIESASVSAISLATPAADTFPYFTGASSATVAPLSPFARTLLDDADAPAMRATLGVASAVSSVLIDAISALSPSGDQGIVFTGTTTAALFSLTPFARGLLDDGNGAAMIETLGAAPAANPTFTGTVHLSTTQMDNSSISEAKTISLNGVIANGNSGTAKTIDWGLGNMQSITMNGNCTFTFTAPPGPCTLHLTLTQSSGSHTWTLPAGCNRRESDS